MATSVRFNAALGVALVASLSWKSAAGGGVRPPLKEEIATATDAMLAEQGYQVGRRVKIGDLTLNLGARGDCWLLVASIPLEGWHEKSLQTMLRPGQSLNFIFNGEYFEGSPPKWPPLFWNYYHKFFALFGFETEYFPLYTTISEDSCTEKPIDFSKQEVFYYKKIER